MRPCPGDAILDLGCGTGELSVYLAELVGQDGKVVAVDPDIDQIKVAQETHRGVKNLTFLEGSAANFPGMGSETYNIVFSNYVLHWIPDKEEAFRNMFSSLKPSGKIALQFNHDDHIPSSSDHAYHELYRLKARSEVEEMCTAAGFHMVKSYQVKRKDRVFKNSQSLCSFLWATTHSAFDPLFATKDRLIRFCGRYASKEVASLRFFAQEGDSHSVLTAVKPAS